MLAKYGVLVNLYPDLVGLENDTPTARQTTITLANAARQASTSTRVSVSCSCKGPALLLPMI